MSDSGVIEIRRELSGYRVVLVPPDPTQPDQLFTDKREAFGCAGGIRMVTGRRKVDLTGE